MNSMRRSNAALLSTTIFALGITLGVLFAAQDERIPVKVVVAAMFERGESRGDGPGELQLWVERLKLDTKLEFPLGEDVLYMNDGREIPDHWPYGMVPLGASEPKIYPDKADTGWTVSTIKFTLHRKLVDWAFSKTRDPNLGDTPAMASYRKFYDSHPAAQRAPFVTIGDTLSSSTYWHGTLLNQWANDWLRLYAGKDANFMTSNMEDSGTMTALRRR